MYKPLSGKIILLIFILLFFNNMTQTASAKDHMSLKKIIEAKLFQTHKTIEMLKLREKQQVNKLYSSQQQLESTEQALQNSTQNLNAAKDKLNNLESNLSQVKQDYYASEREMGQRLKQIYKGETIGLVHLILAADNVNSLMDRVYYQQKITKRDKDTIRKMRTQAIKLASIKRSVEYEKSNIQNTIASQNRQKLVIANNIKTTQNMIEKLRDDRATYEAAERELARQSRSLAAMVNRYNYGNMTTVAGFIRPIYGRITSPFGWRIHPIFRTRSFHSGVDIAASYGTPVYASNAGRVVYSGWYGGYGKVVIVSHGRYRGTNTSTLYAHLSSANVGSGSEVRKGQIIAREGSTGYSTGPHLHFEVRVNGQPTNPLAYIR